MLSVRYNSISRQRRKAEGVLISLLCGLLAVQAKAQDADKQAADHTPVFPDISASIGATVWTGDFGAKSDTTIYAALVGARYQEGGLRLTANIPYMDVRSKGSFFAGIDGTPLFVAPGVVPLQESRSGWGDLTLGASYILPMSDKLGVVVDLSGRIKIPTASRDSQLSTGKVDYAFGVALSKTMGPVIPSASFRYRIYGDNTTWRFHNGVDVTLGAAYSLSRTTIVRIDYDYAERSSDFIADGHSVLIAASNKLGQHFRITGYASKGLSSGAADVSGGASLSLNL